MNFNFEYAMYALPILFFAIGIHEYAHCKFADMAGDPTPRYYGRVTLNLFKHFDPLGAFMIVMTTLLGFGIGWGKPAPMDPRQMKNPKWDHFIAVLAGPMSNLIQAMVFAIAIRMIMVTKFPIDSKLWLFLILGVRINLSLMLFNLLPIGRLDGHWLVGILLPERAQHEWYKFHHSVGDYVLLALIVFGAPILGPILLPPIVFLTRFLVGPVG